MRLSLLALCALVLLGCQPLESKSDGEAPLTYHTIVYDDFAPGLDVRVSPLMSALHGPRKPQRYKKLRLMLELDRRIPVAAEVSVELRLPKGVRLMGGQPSTRLAKNLAPQREQLAFDLDVGELPSEDLVVVVDARGKSFGYHAEHPYRFGRPKPTVVPPEARGRELRVAGRSFGRSIVIPGQ